MCLQKVIVWENEIANLKADGETTLMERRDETGGLSKGKLKEAVGGVLRIRGWSDCLRDCKCADHNQWRLQYLSLIHI